MEWIAGQRYLIAFFRSGSDRPPFHDGSTDHPFKSSQKHKDNLVTKSVHTTTIPVMSYHNTLITHPKLGSLRRSDLQSFSIWFYY